MCFERVNEILNYFFFSFRRLNEWTSLLLIGPFVEMIAWISCMVLKIFNEFPLEWQLPNWCWFLNFGWDWSTTRAFSEVWTSPNCQRISRLICLNCGVRVFVFFWNFGSTQVLRASTFSNRLFQIQNRLFQIQFFCTNFDKKDPKNYEKKIQFFILSCNVIGFGKSWTRINRQVRTTRADWNVI